MIKMHNISKKYVGRNYEISVLNNIEITINQNEFVSIIGKSGSGKSTLLKILGMLDSDFSGIYDFMGNTIDSKCDDKFLSDMRKKIGFIFQDFQLVERYTVKQNVEIAYAIKYGNVDKNKVEASLQKVGILDKINSFPNELSGGQKQRVAIARAIVTNPEIIIADEPTGALDEENTRAVIDILKSIHNDGKTIVLVTHDNDIANVAEKIIQLKDGKLYDVFSKKHDPILQI